MLQWIDVLVFMNLNFAVWKFDIVLTSAENVIMSVNSVSTFTALLFT